MNPKLNTIARVLLPLLISALMVKSAHGPEYVSALLLTLLAVSAVANVFHVPAKVVAVIDGLIGLVKTAQDGSAVAATNPHMMAARRIVRRTGAGVAAGVVILVACLMPAGPTACSQQTGQDVQTVAGPVGVAALDGFMCIADVALAIGGPTDISAIVQQCSRFGVDIAQVYATVQHLLSVRQSVAAGDAGALDAGAALLVDPLTAHLETILGNARASLGKGK